MKFNRLLYLINLETAVWVGAVVVMDNLPAHKVAEIQPLIESVGASVLYLSPYSPEFNPIEHWWSQLKAFLKQFSPKSASVVDGLIKVAALHKCGMN